MVRLGYLGLALGPGCGCGCSCWCESCKGSLKSEFSGSGYLFVSSKTPSGTLGLGTSAVVERFRRVSVRGRGHRTLRWTRKEAGRQSTVLTGASS